MGTKRTDERGKRIAAAVTGLVDEGERLLVVGTQGGKIWIEDATEPEPARLCETQPELYGRLLAVSAALDGAGGPARKILWLAAVVYAAGVALMWMPPALVPPFEDPRSLWGLVLLGAVTLFAVSLVSAVFRGRCWSRLRDGTYRAIGDSGVPPATILALIEGDSRVAKVAARLKKDLARKR